MSRLMPPWPVAGSQPSWSEKTKIRRRPSQKLGIDTPPSAISIARRSTHVSCPPCSTTQPVGCVGDRPRGDDEVSEGDALVRCRPLPVDPDVARAVLHGRDAGRVEDVAVADVAEAAPPAHDAVRARGEAMALGERLHERVRARRLPRVLEPAV